MTRILLGIAILFCGLIFNQAEANKNISSTVTITNDLGGVLVTYIKKYTSWAKKGIRVRIDGGCYSACTLMVGILDKEDICVTPNAILGFHAAGYANPDGSIYYDDNGHRVISASGTALMREFYTPEINRWLSKHGGLGDDIIELKGSELDAMYRQCP